MMIDLMVNSKIIHTGVESKSNFIASVVGEQAAHLEKSPANIIMVLACVSE